MRITLNGEPHDLAAAMSVADLLRSLDLEPKKVAIERNLEILPRSDYEAALLAEGDRLEIVHIIGGG